MPGGLVVALDGDDAGPLPHPVGEEPGEEPDAGVEVEHGLTGLRVELVEDRLDQHRGRPGVHLPEAVLGEAEVVGLPGRLDGAGGRDGRVLDGDQAVVDRHHVVRAVLAQAASAVAGRDELGAGAPAQSVHVTGHRLHHEPGDQGVGGIEAGQPDQLLAHHGGLQVALGGQGDVLEVATSAESRSGDRAGRGDPVSRRLEHLDGVTTPEPVTVGALGDLDDHPLPRDRVPGEDHTGLGLGQPDDAVAAVGHRTDLGVEALADARLALRLRAAGAALLSATHLWICPFDDDERVTRPRRRSPALTRWSPRSPRSRAICDDRSW